MTEPDPRWRKSRRSQGQTNCIQVFHTLDALRDSKNPTGPVIHVAPGAFKALTQDIKANRIRAIENDPAD